MSGSDLDVDPLSNALGERSIDFVVSGSIGAIEAPRAIRALRRLGARITPWQTKGAAQFVGQRALEWSAAQQCRIEFSGTESHIALGDACVVAPASANLVHKISQGIVDTPSSALIASYLGQKKPVLILPTMHDSLMESPAIAQNLATIEGWGCLLPARTEEGKQKVPHPADLADLVAHRLNASRFKDRTCAVTLGGTRAPIDEVRYIGNSSTGSLGSLVAEECFRQGISVEAIIASAERKPHQFVPRRELPDFDTFADYVTSRSWDALIMAAAVSDYEVATPKTGKISSSLSNIDLALTPTKKLIREIDAELKVGFKLESDYADAEAIAERYCRDYGLSLLVFNKIGESSADNHRARLYNAAGQHTLYEGKRSIAHAIVRHLLASWE